VSGCAGGCGGRGKVGVDMVGGRGGGCGDRKGVGLLGGEEEAGAGAGGGCGGVWWWGPVRVDWRGSRGCSGGECSIWL
jgi:hypothetical protein